MLKVNDMDGMITGEACLRMTRELSFFQFLSDQELASVAHYFQCRHVPAGTVLWKQDDPCDYMVFILDGRMLIKVGTEFEGKDVVVGVLGSGSLSGERGMLDGTPRYSTAEALEDLDLIMIDRVSFNRILDEHGELAIKLMKGMLLSVSTRLKNALDRLASVF
jgi:CRP-like cAMP-binding protein